MANHSTTQTKFVEGDLSIADITVLIDKSGSMGHLVSDVEGAIGNFIREQQEEDGICKLSLIQFDHMYEPDPEVSGIDIHTIEPDYLNGKYHPRGGTALYDAILKTIANMTERFDAMETEDLPGVVILVIESDGMENSSTATSLHVAEAIKKCQEKLEWQFIFLGANQDAILSARGMEIQTSGALNFAPTSQGVQVSNDLATREVRTARAAGKLGGKYFASYNMADQAAATGDANAVVDDWKAKLDDFVKSTSTKEE